MTDALLTSTWQTIHAPACKLAESPRFAHGQWMWVDIDGRKLFRCQSDQLDGNRIEVVELPDDVGCVLPTQQPDEYRLYGRQGIYRAHWPRLDTDTFTVSMIQAAPFDPAQYRFNDGRADSRGRAWVSSLSDARQPGAGLFRMDSRTTELQHADLIVGNGLAFSPDGSVMYLSDTRHRKIWRFEFDAENGLLSHQSLIAEYNQGAPRPDGATVAQDGSYLVAIYEGYRLDRYSPDGHLIEEIQVPLAKPTMPCFGGANLQTLLVCSASTDEKLPNKAGFEDIQLIAAQSALPGLPEPLVRAEP